MIVLPALTAEVGLVEPRVRLFGVELLSLQKGPPCPLWRQRGVEVFRARDELVQLEGEEGALAGTAAVALGERDVEHHALERGNAALAVRAAVLHER